MNETLNRTGKNRKTLGGGLFRAAALAALMLAVLSISACGAGSAQQSAGAAQDDGRGAQRTGASGTAAPSIETLDGEDFDLAAKRGKVVGLFFMAGWCGSCIPEAQSWAKLYPAHKDEGLEVLIVSMDPNDTPKTIEGFRKAGGIEKMPWAIDETGGFTRVLGVSALDSTIIVDREGKIAYRDAAPTDAETLESELEEVL